MKQHVLYTFFISFIFLGCNVNNQIQGGFNSIDENLGPTHLSLGALEISGVSDTEVSFSFPYSGDSNNNANVTVHFCSIKVQAGCDPVGTESVDLYKSGGYIKATININSSAVTPGDFLKYKVIASDSDGLTANEESGFVFIPLSNLGAMRLKQFNQFALGGSFNEGLSFVESESVYALIKDNDNNIYIGGASKSSIVEPGGGSYDAFIIKVKANGEFDASFGHKGVVQLGLISSSASEGDDVIQALALDGSGNLFVAGYTSSALGGVNAGGYDGFVLQCDETTCDPQ